MTNFKQPLTCVTLADADKVLKTLTPFSAGNLTGVLESRDGFDIFTVYSYEEVIAEACYEMTPSNYEVYAHAYDYSPTTSKHANIVKKAWGIN